MLMSLLRISVLLLLLIPQVLYAAAIGSVVKQDGVTSVERQGEESALEKNSDIMFKDNVITGKGNIGITFIDDTNVAVSPQSKLVIDEFIYDPSDPSASKLVMNIAAGTVRYASGNIAHLDNQNVDIRTPTAKILVRGTAFSMTVDEIGQSLIILLPNVDGTVGEIAVESDIGQVILNRAFQATTVNSREQRPTPPKILDLTENMINNMLIIKPPKKKEEEGGIKEDNKKKKILANFLDEKKEIDKNCLEEACEGQEEEGGFTRLDVDYLLQNFLANILEELNKQYKKKKLAYSNKDGRVAGYNPNTLVTTIIEGDQVQIIREWDSAIVDITINQSDGGHKINIDQKGSTVPEIYTNETSYNSTIDITIR
jgi:hypothetical protein